jgi:hypothetical protein
MIAAGLLAAALLGPGTASGQPTFTIVTDPTNPIVTDPGHGSQHYFGASWVDYDSDGDDDLFLDQNVLYRNDNNGVFVRVNGSGIGSLQVAQSFSAEGNSWADYDNDGDLDVFLAGEVSYLYVNDGTNQFTPITTGDIGGGIANRAWSPAWADVDLNGTVDLALAHPAGFMPGPAIDNSFFLSLGPPSYGFVKLPVFTGLDSYTVGTWSDYDVDGDPDYFIGSGPANGTTDEDNLYRNLWIETNLPANFERILDPPIATDLQDGQVWYWIDYDNDGDLDAYLTNWSGGTGGMRNRLYRQESDGTFSAITTGAIVTDADLSLASVWGDFDNDGDLDCYVGNDSNGQPDRFYDNQGDGTFTSLNVLTTLNRPRRGAAAADYDDDGDLDLFANGATGNKVLYRNDTANGHAFVHLTLTGTVSNRSAIGARVRAKAVIAGGPRWQLREVSTQNSFLGHNSLRVHLGLRDATTIDSLVVEWPSGIQTVQTSVPVNQFLMIVESGPTAVSETGAARGALRLANHPNPFNPRTTIRYEIPAPAVVELTIHDAGGRLVRRLLSEAFTGPGVHTITWDGTSDGGRPAASGVYHYRLEAGGAAETKRMVLVR